MYTNPTFTDEAARPINKPMYKPPKLPPRVDGALIHDIQLKYEGVGYLRHRKAHVVFTFHEPRSRPWFSFLVVSTLLGNDEDEYLAFMYEDVMPYPSTSDEELAEWLHVKLRSHVNALKKRGYKYTYDAVNNNHDRDFPHPQFFHEYFKSHAKFMGAR